MAEARGTGQALRTYQLLLVLALGWALGRAPEWVAATGAEATRMRAALGEAPAAAAADPDATARLAAEVAARVAAEVADATVARLIAAGWAPGGGAPPVQRLVIEAPGLKAPAPPPTVVRVVAEAPPLMPGYLPGWGYSLPPGAAPASAPAAGGAPQAARPNQAEAHATASAGYAAIRAGELKAGVAQLEQAQALDPEAPEARAWAADAKALTRRWRVAGYTVARAGTGEALAAAPVLGGGQAGVAALYRLNPLGRQRVSLFGRVTVAAGPEGGLDSETTEGALGARWEPSRTVPVALDVERRFAIGTFSRNAWAARVSGGGATTAKAFGLPLKLDGHAEAGVVEGFTSTPDLYAGGQARGGTPLFLLGRTRIDAGAGAWGDVQRSYGQTASRLDLGPSARIRVEPWPFYAQVDYRARVAGNALPGSGPVLTVAGEF